MPSECGLEMEQIDGRSTIKLTHYPPACPSGPPVPRRYFDPLIASAEKQNPRQLPAGDLVRP
jgi:hypothetical protein